VIAKREFQDQHAAGLDHASELSRDFPKVVRVFREMFNDFHANNQIEEVRR